MKNLILLLLLASSLATAQSKKTVYLWLDLTDETLLVSHKEKAKTKVISFFNELKGENRDNSLKVKVMGINHRLISDYKVDIDLPFGTSEVWGISSQSKNDREDQIIKYKNNVLKAIEDIQPVDIYATRIFENLNEEFYNLSEEEGNKYAYVYSDLLENSDMGSIYDGSTVSTNFKFGADLAGIKVFFIRDCPQEKRFNDLCDNAIVFWRSVFGENGYSLKIDSN